MVNGDRDKDKDIMLVSAPTVAGVEFMKRLKSRGIPFAAIVNNKQEFERIAPLGAEHVIVINTSKEGTWIVPELAIGTVYLFEKSLNLCCRYIQICRSWTSGPIYVITNSHNPRLVYKGLGADYVIHSCGSDLSFLIAEDRMNESGR